MGFFDSLRQIAINSNNFKHWEKDQDKRQAQREALYEKRTYTDEEIEKAKALGKNIIEAVDVMDNHSESVAENVETATEPIVGLTPLIATLGTSFVTAKYVIGPANQNIHHLKREIAENISVKELCRKINEEAKNDKEHIRSYDLTSKNKIKNIKNPKYRAEAQQIFEKYMKDSAAYRRTSNLGFLSIPLVAVGSFIASTIYAAKLQVDSSKIARFQARQFLQDPKMFVNYTPEQIEAAKSEIAAHPEWAKKKDKEKEQLKTGMFKSIINLFKDRENYKLAKMLDKDESKLVTRELTPEELKQAERDKEVIQRTVKLINNEAEKYSENMEVAANVIIGSTPFLGAAVGGVLGAILNKAGVFDKIVNNYLDKNCTEETKKLYQDLTEMAKKKKPTSLEKMNYHKQWTSFSSALFNDIDKTLSNEKSNLKLATEGIHTSVIAGLAHKWGKKASIAIVGGFITGIAGSIIGLKLQKSSARAGRYTAKRELEKDPRNFIGYTQEDYDEVKDVENTKQKKSKLKEYALFIPNVLKQYYKYENYRKKEFKQNQLLRETLVKNTEVTDEQLKEANNLQRKIFNTFEKIDDNSQQYSESMEAATEIAQPFIMYGGILTALSPLIYMGIQFKKGKLSAAQIINKITGMLSKSSKIMDSKLFKKYLKELEENVPVKIQSTKVDTKPIGTVLAGVDFKNDNVLELATKLAKNLQGAPNALEKVPSYKIYEQNCKIQKFLEVFPKENENIVMLDKFLGAFRALGKEDQVDLVKILVDPAEANKMPKYRYDRLVDRMAIELGVSKDQMAENVQQINTLIDMFASASVKDMEQLGLSPKTIEAFEKGYKIENFIPDNLKDPKIALNDFKTKINLMSDSEVKDFMAGKISSMDKKTLLEIIPKIEKIIDNIPKEEITKIKDTLIKEINEHPDELVNMVASGKVTNIFLTPTVKKAAIAAGVSWTALNLVITYAIEAWFADMQLKAGRLGVMKSLEALDDNRYYANIEPMVAE